MLAPLQDTLEANKLVCLETITEEEELYPILGQVDKIIQFIIIQMGRLELDLDQVLQVHQQQ
jgi:hypothetical protein